MESPSPQFKTSDEVLIGNKENVICFSVDTNQTELIAFSDSDLARDLESRKCTTGIVIMRFGVPISCIVFQTTANCSSVYS